MTLSEEIREASKRHDAFNVDQMVAIMSGKHWVEIDGHYYLDQETVDPTGFLLNLFYMRPTVINDQWEYSVDAVMAVMKDYPENFGGLFRNSIFAKAGC